MSETSETTELKVIATKPLTEMEQGVVDLIGEQVKELGHQTMSDIFVLANEKGGKVSITIKSSLEILGKTAVVKTEIDAKRSPIHAVTSDELEDDSQGVLNEIDKPAKEQGKKGKKKTPKEKPPAA